MTNKIKKQILDNAKEIGRDDLIFMNNEDEGEKWTIGEYENIEIDDNESNSTLNSILEDTNVTKEEVYENNFIYQIKDAYREGWNEEAKEKGLE